jgi:hypothetical protein
MIEEAVAGLDARVHRSSVTSTGQVRHQRQRGQRAAPASAYLTDLGSANLDVLRPFIPLLSAVHDRLASSCAGREHADAISVVSDGTAIASSAVPVLPKPLAFVAWSGL